MKRLRLFSCACLLSSLAVAPPGAAAAEEFWPGAEYDPAIPSFEAVLGHDPGERLVAHADMFRYLEALASAAPDRIRLFDYATSWQGRRLGYAIVGSPTNLARLDEIRSGMQRLAEPRTLTTAEAEALMARLPAVVWLSYGVHGDEISSPDAGLLTAYHLLAARGDELVDEVLADAIVIINPTQNPDGRDRFVHGFRAALGLEPSAHRFAAEHVQPWPGGRTNHYLFDLNRDWVMLSQPETQGLSRVLREWYPLVHVDLHEMGTDSTYFFPPTSDPANPNITQAQLQAMELFGRNNGHWFDRFGFPYFTRDVYDAFYPGYGDMLPTHHGSIGMTYEQASVRGLVARRADGTIFHFRDSVRQHFVASLSTAQTAARHRLEMLGAFHDYRRSAVEEGSRGAVREYVLPRSGDVSLVDEAAALLVEHGIEVRRATAARSACGSDVPEGSYFVSLAQPTKRLIRSLLDPEVPLDSDFLAEQERLRAKRLEHQMYDIVAWSIPLSWNLDLVTCGEPVGGADLVPVTSERSGGGVSGTAEVAYLVPWGSSSAGRFLTAALREGLTVTSNAKGFRQGEVQYPSGTLIVPIAANGASVHETVLRLARESGAEVAHTDQSWVDEGASFGSPHAVRLLAPEIGLAWDRPTSPSSVGATRFVIERRFGYPVTPVRTASLTAADLADLDVLILPNGGGYEATMGSAGAARLKRWVADGGVLVALGGATAFVADSDVALLDVQQENSITAAVAEKKAGEAKTAKERPNRVPGRELTSEDDLEEATRPEDVLPDAPPGVLVRAQTDADHWLGAGAREGVNVLLTGSAIFTPIKRDKGANVLRFAAADELIASGHLWEENRRQLAYKPFVVVQRHGRGLVIAFTADPSFRAYIRGLDVLLLNALFRAPAHARAGV
jgi:putative intracellular protease/amidase